MRAAISGSIRSRYRILSIHVASPKRNVAAALGACLRRPPPARAPRRVDSPAAAQSCHFSMHVVERHAQLGCSEEGMGAADVPPSPLPLPAAGTGYQVHKNACRFLHSSACTDILPSSYCAAQIASGALLQGWQPSGGLGARFEAGYNSSAAAVRRMSQTRRPAKGAASRPAAAAASPPPPLAAWRIVATPSPPLTRCPTLHVQANLTPAQMPWAPHGAPSPPC